MAKDNVEVEVKVRLTKSQFQKIRQQIKKTSKFIKTSHHIDTYYSPIHPNFLKPKHPYKWLSIRQRDKKVLLNFKHWYPEGAKHTTHCDEYETHFENKDQLGMILNALNINKLVTIDKKREVYIYENKIELAFDEVKTLGYFMEAESLNNTGGIEKTYKYLEDFVKSLGVKKVVTIPGGYAAELMRKKGLMK